MFRKKLKIAMYLNHPPQKKNACTVYRNITPFKYLKSKVEVRYIDKVETEIEYNSFKREVVAIKVQAEPIEWADVVVFSRHYDQVALMGTLAETARKLGKAIVYETDDLLHRVNQNLGKGVSDDSRDITKQMRFVDHILKYVDLVTVTTQPLKDFYQKEIKQNIEVLANYFDPAHWRGLYFLSKLRRFWRRYIKGDKRIRIGWQGGNNHLLNNFNYIVEPLNELNKKYGDRFEFIAFSGQNPNEPLAGTEDRRKLLNFPFKHVPGVSVDKFYRKLASLDLDIGLIVVEDNEFSRAKSNIKWMEYALLGIPSVASACEPYRETNAILVDNSVEAWTRAVEELLLNAKKRAIMGAEARRMVKGYNIKNHAWKWLKAYKNVLQLKKGRA